ncbi:MAG: DMT family transporter [Candidatus Hydrogenedentes bacterium]|nr:DMT family transporter [Candidatus Hydrogenedentota bacterium]
MSPSLTTNKKAIIALALAIGGWSLSPIFIRYLREAYDPYTQSGVRYIGSILFLIPYSYIVYRKELLKAFLSPIPTFLLSLINVFMQSLWTIGIYYSTASLGQILVKIQIPIVSILSFIVFQEERNIIKSWRFIVGSLLALAGSILLVYEPSIVSVLPKIYLATICLFLSALLWGVYSVYGKHTVANELHPVPMFAVISIYTTIGLFVLGFLIGEPQKLIQAPTETHTIAVFSGIIPIAIAHSAFHYAQKYLGSAFTNTMLTLTPLTTHGLALIIWRDEALTLIQWTGTIILLTGCMLVVWARSNNSINSH